MTPMEHFIQEINKGIESVQANTGTFADADPIAVIAVAACAIFTVGFIIFVEVVRRK